MKKVDEVHYFDSSVERDRAVIDFLDTIIGLKE